MKPYMIAGIYTIFGLALAGFATELVEAGHGWSGFGGAIFVLAWMITGFAVLEVGPWNSRT